MVGVLLFETQDPQIYINIDSLNINVDSLSVDVEIEFLYIADNARSKCNEQKIKILEVRLENEILHSNHLSIAHHKMQTEILKINSQIELLKDLYMNDL